MISVWVASMHELWPLSSPRRWEIGRAVVEASWLLLCFLTESHSENAPPLTYGKQSGQEVFAKLAHKGRAAGEQIQLSLGHASVTTTKPNSARRVGRPRVAIKSEQVIQLRSMGTSWRQIAKALGIGTPTPMRLCRGD